VTVHAERLITPQDKSRGLQRKLCLRAKSKKSPWSDLMWQVMENWGGQELESSKKKVVGEPDEGKPHVRFDVAGNGNQE
jgi:hypothetical protein